jgi:hypothetical protein
MAICLARLIQNQIPGIIHRKTGNSFQLDELLPFDFPSLLLHGQYIADPVIQRLFLLFEGFNLAFQRLFLRSSRARSRCSSAFFSRTSFSNSRRDL